MSPRDVSPRVYYNDSEPFVCDWLENLQREGLIPRGEVDRRPIQEVAPDDLKGFTQCHFFAGIGGWAYALELAGWGDREAWTGSCPCQSLSGAGSRLADADPRHLWPAFYRLIAQCKPPVVFGEQVAGALGREWFSAVRADLEAVGYACGAADLCAPMVGATHNRARLFFVADADGDRWESAEAWQSTHDAKRDMEARREVGRAKRDAVGPSAESPWTPGPCCVATIPRHAHGIPAFLGGVIRATGNAIVPQVAASFIKAYMEVAA